MRPGGFPNRSKHFMESRRSGEGTFCLLPLHWKIHPTLLVGSDMVTGLEILTIPEISISSFICSVITSIPFSWVSILAFLITSSWVRRILCLHPITWLWVIATLVGPILPFVLWAAVFRSTLGGGDSLVGRGNNYNFYSSPFYYSPYPLFAVVFESFRSSSMGLLQAQDLTIFGL